MPSSTVHINPAPAEGYRPFKQKLIFCFITFGLALATLFVFLLGHGYDSGRTVYGISLFFLVLFILVVILVICIALLIVQHLRQRDLTEASLRASNTILQQTTQQHLEAATGQEKKYGHLLENMREGIQILGYDWSYLFLNAAAIAQSRFTRKELLGHTFIEKYPGITDTPFFTQLNNCMQERTAEIVENEFTFPDGNVRWFALSIQPVPEGLLILSIDVTDRKLAEVELTKRMTHERQLATRISLQAQERERNELGRELHDNINQILATAKMYLEVLVTGPEDWLLIGQRSAEHLNLAIGELRNLSHSLVAPSLGEASLREVLESLALEIGRPNALQVTVVDECPDPLPIDTQQELALYRIAQEQLNNICKYAKATHVRLVLKIVEEGLSFSITDDGIGFDPGKNTRGIGLRNIRNRVEVFSGRLKIVAAPQEGCALEVILPISAKS